MRSEASGFRAPLVIYDMPEAWQSHPESLPTLAYTVKTGKLEGYLCHRFGVSCAGPVDATAWGGAISRFGWQNAQGKPVVTIGRYEYPYDANH